MNVTRSSTKAFVGSLGTTIVGFVGLVAFARLLGSELLGAYFLFQALISMLGIAADLGVRTGVEKQMSGEARRDVVLSSALVLYAITLVPAVTGVLLLSAQVNAYVGAPVAHLLVLALAVRQANRLVMSALKGELRVGETATLQFAEKVLWLVAGLALVRSGAGTLGPVWGVVIGSAGSLAWGLWKLDTTPATPTLSRVRGLLTFAKYNFIPSVGLKIHSWMDVLLIGYLLSQTMVGAYEVSWKVAGTTTLLAGAIGSTLLPQVSAWDSDDRSERIGAAVSAAITPSLVIILPAIVGGLVLAPEILGLVFGPEFTVASVAFVVLVAGKVPGAIQGIVGRVLLGLDKPHLVARATLYMIALNLGLNVVLIATFGLVGAAVGTTVAFTAGLLVRVRYLQRFVSIRVPYRELGWCVLASAIMGVVVAGLAAEFAIDSIVRLAAVIAVGATVYTAVVMSTRRFRVLAASYVSSLTAAE